MAFHCNLSRKHTKYSHCWHKHNTAKSDAKVSHSVSTQRRSDQVFKMSLTSCSFYTSSSVKIWSPHSTVDAGKRRSGFRARVRCTACNSEFLHKTLLQAIQLEILTNDTCTKEWWIPVSRVIWRAVLYAYSWLKITLLTESMLSSVRALWGRPLPWCLIVLPVFLNVLNNLFKPETIQSLPWNCLGFCQRNS